MWPYSAFGVLMVETVSKASTSRRRRFTTVADIDFTIEQVTQVVTRLRAMSPLWDLVQAGVDLNTIQWSEH